MGEFLLIAQALLLLVGWFTYQHLSNRLREQARAASLDPEIEKLERTVERLLSKLARESERVKSDLEAWRRLATAADERAAGDRQGRVAVITLAKGGLGVQEIAKRTGRPVSEIELLVRAAHLDSAITAATRSDLQQEET